MTSTSDSEFKSRLQDSTENWDSHKKKNGPSRMLRPKSLMQEGQSLSTNPFHQTPHWRVQDALIEIIQRRGGEGCRKIKA